MITITEAKVVMRNANRSTLKSCVPAPVRALMGLEYPLVALLQTVYLLDVQGAAVTVYENSAPSLRKAH